MIENINYAISRCTADGGKLNMIYHVIEYLDLISVPQAELDWMKIAKCNLIQHMTSQLTETNVKMGSCSIQYLTEESSEESVQAILDLCIMAGELSSLALPVAKLKLMAQKLYPDEYDKKEIAKAKQRKHIVSFLEKMNSGNVKKRKRSPSREDEEEEDDEEKSEEEVEKKSKHHNRHHAKKKSKDRKVYTSSEDSSTSSESDSDEKSTSDSEPRSKRKKSNEKKKRHRHGKSSSRKDKKKIRLVKAALDFDADITELDNNEDLPLVPTKKNGILI